METGVKTNEDMYPLNHDFFLLSFFLLFFFFDISAKSRGLFGGEQVQVNVFKISWSFARLWHTTLKLGKFTISFNAIFVAVYLCLLTGSVFMPSNWSSSEVEKKNMELVPVGLNVATNASF